MTAQPDAVEPTVNLLETELAVRYALHEAGADLGEPIDIKFGGQRPASVAVAGIVSSNDRKQQLLGALSGIPHVVAQLQTEEETLQHERRISVTRAEPRIVAARSPIEIELLAYFGDPSAVETFSRKAVALTEGLMSHAWALRHLSERYSALESKDDSALSLSSRQLLQIMRRDHYRTMFDAAAELTTLMSPILRSISDSPVESVAKLPLFDSTQQVQRLTLDLLSGSRSSDASGHTLPAKAAEDLLISLRGLESTLEDQR